jgi:hypothetical protein
VQRAYDLGRLAVDTDAIGDMEAALADLPRNPLQQESQSHYDEFADAQIKEFVLILVEHAVPDQLQDVRRHRD